MKKALLIAALAASAAGCQQFTPPNATASATAVAAAPAGAPQAAPVKFEVRDFHLDADSSSYGVTTKGRGTLITRDPALAKGAYMVWISAKQAHKSDEQAQSMILMTDGIGTINTYDYASKSDGPPKEVKYYDWSVIGYAKLDRGVIVNPEQETSAPTASAGNH